MNNKLFVKENDLFAVWKTNLKDEDKNSEFIPDGLLGSDLFYEDGQWKRQSGCESINWLNASIRPLFLLKDLNGDSDGAYDIRTASCLNTDPERPKEGDKLGRNLIRYCYGIIQCCRTGIAPSFEEAKAYGVELFKETALVRMNVKKTMGTSKIDKSTIENWIVRYSEYITAQLSIYDANIIYSGGIGMKPNEYLKIIPDWEYYTPIDTGDANKDNLWILYAEKLNKIIINGYHLSHRYKEDECYDKIMVHLVRFLEMHPEFREQLFKS